MSEILPLANVLQMPRRERISYLKSLSREKAERAKDAWWEEYSNFVDEIDDASPGDDS